MNTSVKKTIALIAALSVAATFAFAAKPKKEKKAKQQTIVIGTEGSWPPYNFVDAKGNLTGYDIDVLRAIEERIPGVAFKIEPTEWDGMFVALETGRIQVIGNELSWNEERGKKYLYTARPYNYSYSVIVFKKGRTDIKTPYDLFGKTVLVGVGSHFAQWIEEFNAANGNKITIEYDSGNTARIFNDVATGRVDATIDSPVSVQSFVESNGLPLQTVRLAEAGIDPAYFVFPKNAKGEETKRLFDDALAAIIADGTLSKLAIKWFGTDTSRSE